MNGELRVVSSRLEEASSTLARLQGARAPQTVFAGQPLPLLYAVALSVLAGLAALITVLLW